MTIREHLDKQEYPYKYGSRICLALFIVGSIALYTEIQAEAFINGSGQWRYWAFFATGFIYVVGGVGIMTIAFLQVLRVRCPKCNQRLRSRTKNWNQCPLCGIDFEKQLPGQGSIEG
jgi:hypothetical protein